MMDTKRTDPDPDLLALAAALLDGLRPDDGRPRRDSVWRTTEQIAIELGRANETGALDQVLRQHEARCHDRLARGLPSEAKLRRAKYPDRTSALPLWGSVRLHGEPWAENRSDRSDPPDDIPASLRVAEGSPRVFLSHTRHDAALALRLAEALAEMQIGCWRFESHIDQCGDIADCVRKAIAETSGVVSLVTRSSIASLWVLTELHTSLELGVPVVLVVDCSDALLLTLLRSVRFQRPNDMFDLSVQYEASVVEALSSDYALRETASRVARYPRQVNGFLATLPSYLGSVPREGADRIWRPALAFPEIPENWSGEIALGDLKEFPTRLRPGAGKASQTSAGG